MNNGLKQKYFLSKTSGNPIDPKGVYFVLKLNSKDPIHAKASIEGARTYARIIRHFLPELAHDLEQLCDQYENRKKVRT